MLKTRPLPGLLNLFRGAVALKLFTTVVALGLGYWLTGQWLWGRWGLVLADELILGLFLWPRLLPLPRQLQTLWQQVALPFTLALAILLMQVEQIHFALLPPPATYLNTIPVDPFFLERLNLLQTDSFFFVLIPILLASWQYNRRGLRLSIGWTAVLYFAAGWFIASQTWPTYALTGLVKIGFLTLAGFIVQRLAEGERRDHAQLEAAHRQLAQQTAVLEQLTISRERNRLARELHDTLAHSLTAVAIQLQAVQTLLKVDPAAAGQALAQAQQQTRLGIEESRRAITALRASPLEELGLVEALRHRAQATAERLSIPVHCQLEGEGTLPPLTEQTIYRVADEALHNAEKHAQAKRIAVSFSQEEGAWLLRVADDGVGFDVGREAGGNGRYGLVGLQERADLIGAHLTIASQPGHGTQITLQSLLPVAEATA